MKTSVKPKVLTRFMSVFIAIFFMITTFAPIGANAYSSETKAEQKWLSGWSYNYQASKYKGISMYSYYANKIPYFITDDNAVAYCINFTKLNTDSYINKF